MRPSLAIHGGAGTILKSEMTPDLEKEYRHGLQSALDAGWAVLSKGGPALEAVQSAVVSLEDFPLFNAGRGSVFTHTARNEMDACIMDGARLMSGAVAFVSNIRNPITLARLVMEETEHCLLAGNGAVEFAREHGRVTIGEATRLTGASRNTLKQHFRTLTENGTLNRHGSGRGVWYDLR